MQAISDLELPHLAMEEPWFAANPAPQFAAARAAHPWLASSNLGYVVTGYAAVRELRIPHAASQTQSYVTVSIGVVAVDAYRMASHDAAVELADQALYEAKNRGRDRFIGIDPDAKRLDPGAARAPRATLREASGS